VEPSPKNHPNQGNQASDFFPLFPWHFLPSFFFPSTVNQRPLLEMPDAQPRVRRRATEACTFCRKRKVPYPIPPSLVPIPSCSVSSRGTNPYPDQVQRSTPVMHQLPDLRERMRLRTRSRCVQSRRSAETSAPEEQICQSQDRFSQRYGSPRIISHR